VSIIDLEKDNIGLVRDGFRAFAAGDMAALGGLFDANAAWHSQPTGILIGEYQGRDAIFAMFGKLHQETAGTFRSTPIAMAATGDKVFVQTETTGERHGRSLRGGEVLVFTVADGRVREVRIFTGDYAALQTFWA
jgi:ketosteroid isomerase-like protein